MSFENFKVGSSFCSKDELFDEEDGTEYVCVSSYQKLGVK